MTLATPEQAQSDLARHDLREARAVAAAQLARIDAELVAMQAGQRAERIAEVLALMAEHGLSLADIAGKPTRAAHAPKATKISRPATHRNQDDHSQTWCGLGKRPKFIVDALAAGRRLDEFKIAA